MIDRHVARELARDLEKEYDNSGRVQDAAKLLDKYIADAVDYRNEVAGNAIFDQTYGPNDRNKMDIFWPGKDHNVPLAMFIHGGYWQRLDRSAFSHMAKGLNKRGVAVAIPSYTLCPNITISGIIDELRRACIILWKTYKKPITVFGHSAGGHLAACMLATKWNRIHESLPEELVQSAMSISGVFELAPLIETSHNKALRLNAEDAKNASPYNWLIEPGQRFEAWVGSEESAEFLRQSRSQVQRWRMMGGTTRFIEIPGANHFTAIDSLSDPRSTIVARLLKLMEAAEPPTLESLSFINPKKKTTTADPAAAKGKVEKNTLPDSNDAKSEQVKSDTRPTGKSKPESDNRAISTTTSPDVKSKAIEPKPTKAKEDKSQQAQPSAKNQAQPQTTMPAEKSENATKTNSSPSSTARTIPLREKVDNKTTPPLSTSLHTSGQISGKSEIRQTPPARVTNADKAPQTPPAAPKETAASRPDDLTIISGIGDTLQARLVDLGFTTFEQLAELTDTQKNMIEEILDFKGRIDREHWITQARHQKAIKELAG